MHIEKPIRDNIFSIRCITKCVVSSDQIVNFKQVNIKSGNLAQMLSFEEQNAIKIHSDNLDRGKQSCNFKMFYRMQPHVNGLLISFSEDVVCSARKSEKSWSNSNQIRFIFEAKKKKSIICICLEWLHLND
uniref:Uncharacterized protein n=1 Tax=Glossina pallidipes TaxID=7398 RepID=A0A1A9ZPK9_GLOPL